MYYPRASSNNLHDTVTLGSGIGHKLGVDNSKRGNQADTKKQQMTAIGNRPHSPLSTISSPDHQSTHWQQQQQQHKPQPHYHQNQHQQGASSQHIQQKKNQNGFKQYQQQQQQRSQLMLEEMEKEANVTVFVGNLAEQTSKTELRNMFSQFGQIEKISRMTDYNGDPYCFVKFRYPGGAKRALLASERDGGLRTRDHVVLNVRPRAFNTSMSAPTPVNSGSWISDDLEEDLNDDFEKNENPMQNDRYLHQSHDYKSQYLEKKREQKNFDLISGQRQQQSQNNSVWAKTQVGLEPPAQNNLYQLPDTKRTQRMAPVPPIPLANVAKPTIPFRTVLVHNIPETWSAQDLYKFYHGALYRPVSTAAATAATTSTEKEMVIVGVFLYADNQRTGLVEFANHEMAFSACTSLVTSLDGKWPHLNDRKVMPTDIWSLDAWLGGVQMRSGPVIQAYE